MILGTQTQGIKALPMMDYILMAINHPAPNFGPLAQWLEVVMQLQCKYCGKTCGNTGGLAVHESACKNNINIKPKKPKSEAWLKAMSERRGNGQNQFTKAKQEGRECIVSQDTREKLSVASSNIEWTDQRRKAHSERMKRAVSENPSSYSSNNVCGRNCIEYRGHKLKGNWELLVAKWLDANNIEWEGETHPQEYIWRESPHLYFPDFYLPAYECFIEVKGYKTERDECKWAYCTKPLYIIRGEHIKLLDTNTFDTIKELIRYKGL
ncbi:hypothetical protein Kuja_0500 [Vibrio phage vB_VchM_Kuja]|uniref:Uncharacterized protein n=1 Tax=Vibrio phage vB_VchM_Kuja TaxID=2686437 RepID=A0A6B9J5B3_9CAUD|nr:endonuclease [Vibrio phage vB_VchM_Kuja]QGZ16041.1 hypothetical protein Kuja_0500 [Vibrio phage vB_VchM_Kuja]